MATRDGRTASPRPSPPRSPTAPWAPRSTSGRRCTGACGARPRARWRRCTRASRSASAITPWSRSRSTRPSSEGGPRRLLGRLHAVAPRVPLFTGWVSRTEGVEHLERAVAIAPEDLANRLYLAEARLELEPAHARSGAARDRGRDRRRSGSGQPGRGSAHPGRGARRPRASPRRLALTGGARLARSAINQRPSRSTPGCSGRAASTSLTVRPSGGSGRSGSRSASGWSAKRRSRSSGCGSRSSAVGRHHVVVEQEVDVERPRSVTRTRAGGRRRARAPCRPPADRPPDGWSLRPGRCSGRAVAGCGEIASVR